MNVNVWISFLLLHSAYAEYSKMKIVSAGVPCAIQYIDRSSAVADLLDEAEKRKCKCVLFVSQQLETNQKIAIKELDLKGIHSFIH